jgi:hypothetical protein
MKRSECYGHKTSSSSGSVVNEYCINRSRDLGKRMRYTARPKLIAHVADGLYGYRPVGQ